MACSGLQLPGPGEEFPDKAMIIALFFFSVPILKAGALY
jgi:hypothetical protein